MVKEEESSLNHLVLTDGERERKFTEPLGADRWWKRKNVHWTTWRRQMVKEKERSLNHLRAVRWWRRKNSLNHLRAHRSHAQCTAVCGRCKLPRTCRCSVDQNGAQGQCSRKYLQVLMSPRLYLLVFTGINVLPPLPSPAETQYWLCASFI